ncbi:MAG: hypothetical protein KC609_08815, partial [Myxococcales bacterium]|nr:hypothetical protein [Myxococcales bacterium]
MKSEARWYQKLHWWILLGMVIGAAIGATLNWADNSHSGSIAGLQALGDGRHLVTAGRDGTLKLWRFDRGSLRWLRTVRGHTSEI